MTFPGYPLEKWPRKIVPPSGRGTSGILAVGEAPGEKEEAEGRPFVEWAEAGSVLQRAFERAGIPRDSLTLTNMVSYRPPKNELLGTPWEMDAIRAGAPLLEDLVGRTKPKVILALGGIAWRELSGLSGEKCGILACRGFVVPGLLFRGIPVVGTYHPSLLRRGSKERQKEEPRSKVEAAGGGTQGMALLGALIRDLLLAQKVAREGAPKFKYDNYILGATLDDWLAFERDCREHPELPISYDWETPRSTRELSEEEIEAGEHAKDIIQGQMSLRPGSAIVSKFFPELIPVWTRILGLPNPKLDWNGRKFDRPLAQDYGMILNGPLHDGMDLWHHAQPDLPRGLQYATSFFCPEVGPWKHLIEDESLFYGALDVDMPLRVFYGLQKTLSLQREPHSGISLWEGYQSQVLDLSPVLDRMKVHGIPVAEDIRASLGEEFGKVQDEINGKMQEASPEEIRNVEPKEGFKRKQKLPPECLEASGQERLFPVDGGGTTEGATNPSRVVTATGTTYVVRTFQDSKTKEDVKRWARLLPFSPSSQQVIKYIKFQGWEVPKDVKTDRDTSNELALRKLLGKHPKDPLIPLILDYREVEKAKSTYVDNWKPSPQDGCVHSTFGFRPATGQLSSEDPNAQNFPKHSKIARKMRRMIRARGGRRLVSFDWKSFHVLTLGFEAQDPLYMRMARLDMHSFFALTGLLRLETADSLLVLGDDELQARLKWWKKQERVFPAFSCTGHPGGMTFSEIRDERAKRAILGVGFGQSGPGLYKRNPESFNSQREAERCLQELNGVFPLPQKWRTAVRLEGDREHQLITRHGFVRHFWDVFSRKAVPWNYDPKPGQIVIEDPKGGRKLLAPGDDHEAVVAYRPANDAFGIKRLCMVELGRRGWDLRFGLINEIHDDLDFEPEESKVEECIQNVRALMEAPSRFLVDPKVAPEGLSCKVEVKVGRNLDFRDSENPEGMGDWEP